jgi:hypothetical protein
MRPLLLVTLLVATATVACSDDSNDDGTGASGSGASGAGGGIGANGGGGATSASGGGGSGPGGSGGGGTGGAPVGCANPELTLCEDFEDADDGSFPEGWGPRGDEWGEGTLGVASDDPYRGAKSLKADGGNNGQHFMDYAGDLGALASHHYGRVFMKVAIPAPFPSSGVLHADFIEGLGPGPNGGTHNVRWGVVENADMFQWIYNVQPSNGAPEFAEGTAYIYSWTGAWQCIEWTYDEPTQSGTLWIDDIEIPITPGENHAAEIPVFESLGVGLANYQPAGSGFTVWFDDLAYDESRIGCE